MFDISPLQIIIVLAIALLVFGPKRLPEMGRSIGRGLRDFKDGLTGDGHAEPVANPSGAVAIATAPEAAEPSLEQIVKENATPAPVEQPVAGPTP